MKELVKCSQLSRKSEIRKSLIELRAKMTNDSILCKSKSLSKTFLSHFSNDDSIKSIALYSPVNSEVDTKIIHNELIRQGKMVLYPKTLNDRLIFVKFESFDSFVRGVFNVLEPLSNEHVDINEIDLFVVPCVGIGIKGKRLGYGGGFYDRALEFTPKARICSIIYDFQLLREFNGEMHDIEVSKVFTDLRFLRMN